MSRRASLKARKSYIPLMQKIVRFTEIFIGLIFGYLNYGFADVTDSGNGVVGGTFTVTGNAFSVGGSTLTVKNGNVGVGSANPGAPLSVKDTNAPAAGTYIQTAVGSYIGWDYLSGTSASKRWAIRNDGATYGDFQIVTESGNQGTGLNATRLYINGSGNVGIGTTSPGSLLDVVSGGTTLLTMGSWTSWTPTFTGFSVNPTVNVAKYIRIGKTVIAYMDLSAAGTSNSTQYRFTLPFAPLASSIRAGWGTGMDNGVNLTAPCVISTNSGTTTTDIYKDASTAGWTNAGAKACDFTVVYEAQ